MQSDRLIADCEIEEPMSLDSDLYDSEMTDRMQDLLPQLVLLVFFKLWGYRVMKIVDVMSVHFLFFTYSNLA